MLDRITKDCQYGKESSYLGEVDSIVKISTPSYDKLSWRGGLNCSRIGNTSWRRLCYCEKRAMDRGWVRIQGRSSSNLLPCHHRIHFNTCRLARREATYWSSAHSARWPFVNINQSPFIHIYILQYSNLSIKLTIKNNIKSKWLKFERLHNLRKTCTEG